MAFRFSRGKCVWVSPPRGALARTNRQSRGGSRLREFADEGRVEASGSGNARGGDDWVYTISAAKIAEGAHEEGSRLSRNWVRGPFARPIRTELVYFSPAPGTAPRSPIRWFCGNRSMLITSWSMPRMALCSGEKISRTIKRKPRPTVFTRTTARGRPRLLISHCRDKISRLRGISRTTVTLIGNESPNTFNNLGWITDGVNITTSGTMSTVGSILFPGGVDAGGQAHRFADARFRFRL